MAERHLALEDLRLARDPEHVLTLFRKLAYRVEPEPVPLNPTDLEFPDRAGIHRCFLLADHPQPPGLQVFLFELDDTRMANLRLLARDLLARPGHYLFVAAPGKPLYPRLVFVHPRRVGDGRVGIRKLVLDPAHPTRHDLDVLEGIAADGLADDPDGLYLRQAEAFDVERLTNRFYRAYADLFHRTLERVQEANRAHPVLATPEGARAFTQRLLHRLLFLYFLQRKGWLAGDPRFLTTWCIRTIRADPPGNVWRDLLRPLFFETLNRRRLNDASPWGEIPYLNGRLFEPVPPDTDDSVFLPNDLFDPRDPEGLLGFLNGYNFTVAEDTPLEQEVALDPELLGKVFENLLEEAERGQTGTFYTPRSIVHYLARRALWLYLKEQTGLPDDRLKVAFSEDEGGDAADPVAPLRPHEADRIERALDEVRVLDPAVGSGAFLMGMLHELVALRRACYRARGVEVPRGSSLVAKWKREFIAHSLYGVDIKPEAVEIARLRLWLSLVVDLARDQVEPLPNLDYKLMVGDSLLETVDGEPILTELPAGGDSLPGVYVEPVQLGLEMGEADRARADLVALKERYFAAEEKAERDRLRAQIEAQERAVVLAALEEKLADVDTRIQRLVARGSQINWRGMRREKRELERLAQRKARLTDLAARVRAGEPLPFFLYRLHFYEVFRDKGGFDIVLANPPYVRMEHIKEQKAEFRRAYPQVYDGRADLYVYFYARGLDLLRPGGVLAYISSNKFMRARYGAGLRRFLTEETTLEEVIDFGDLPVFDATAYPCLVVTRKRKPPKDCTPRALTVDDLEMLERLEEEVPRRAWPLPQVALRPDGWTLERPEVLRLVEKLRAAGQPLEEVIKERFYRGIVTGLNEAFVIDEATRQRLVAEDPHSAEIIKPWLRGRDVKRWRVNWAGLYVIFTYHGVDIERYPAIRAYLEPFRERLERRATSAHHAWYELQQPQMGIYPEFEKPKIVYPEFAPAPTFSYDTGGKYYVANKLYVIPTDALWLLGVLNSRVVAFLLPHICSLIRGNYIQDLRS
ncbi:MAG TPA: type II restriction endonuclease [Thermoflexia bacterium]|nr:type II restriction endonuclease [Thermoflexia bacterium]